MSAFKTYKFPDLFDLQLHLNGGLKIANLKNGVVGLQGKTVIFTSPAGATVTFGAPANGYSHTAAEILSAFLTGTPVAGLSAGLKDGCLWLSGGVTISGGTALTSLGIGKNGATQKKYNGPGGAAPYFVQAYSANDEHVLVVVE